MGRISALGSLLLCVDAATLVLMSGCGPGSPTQPNSQVVASVVVTPARDTILALGQTRQFVAVARNATGGAIAGKVFAWQSSAPTVLAVGPATGVATALAQGDATISASVEGKAGQASVLVAQQVSTVEVSPGNPNLNAIGANQQFTAVAKDANGAVVGGVQFLWLSSDPTVATVDNSGKATAKAPGTTTITAAGLGVPGSTTLTVTQTATQLVFTVQPGLATEGVPFPGVVQVEIRDANGALVTGARNAVSLSVANNPGGGVLSGTTLVNAVGGITSFSGLSISQAGTGYTLRASVGLLTPATSAAFNVFLNFVGVGASNTTTCGLTASAALYCWGLNAQGELGDGTTTARLLPTRVLAPAAVRFVAISQQIRDIVGTTNCALAQGGAAYCWGFGGTGAIGDGQTVNRLTATLVTPPAGVAFTSVSAGNTFACGVATSGIGYCWGNGVVGNLGDGTATSHFLPGPVIPPAGVFFSSIAAGFSTACGTTSLGAGYCWGSGIAGKIGDGATVQRNSPTPVAAPAGVNFSVVQGGGAGSCGLTFAGAIYCWGANTFGEIGDGTNTDRLTPVPVAAPAGITFMSLATNLSHTCALSTAGAAYCWGSNNFGELGDGTLTSRNAPTAVVMPVGVSFVAISTGNLHTCGVTALGAMYCWGFGSGGALGDGTFSNRTTPVRVQR